MNTRIETITSDALTLPEDQRLTLAHRILASVEPTRDRRIEAAWDGEIRERIRRFDAGESVGVPATLVFDELDKKFGR